MYDSILLAVDGSEQSMRAAKEAARLAAAGRETQVTILHVVQTETSKEALAGASQVELDLSRRKKTLAAEQALQAQQVYYDVKVLYGRPGPAIVEYINGNRFDLVVIGSRGLNRMEKVMRGSVSQRVLNQTDCSVLIVR
ncbi:universal stress protein [Planococcus salinus]|uniref:Universal stress protein n=1 Tax=Planococcus salinus TaxID=1848460 RepID=A0A3M8P4Z2_9BACL|nr:universal stress protein [Planococcus salinus]RNF38736.1 universal stress protein [Planococcus salinus]